MPKDLTAGGTVTGSCIGHLTSSACCVRRSIGRTQHERPSAAFLAAYLRLRLKLLGEKLGFGIPLNAFGPGLSVAHVAWVHVHHRATIGANCRIHRGVTIGEGRPGEYPTIGDDVFIYPGAMVLGANVGSRVGI